MTLEKFVKGVISVPEDEKQPFCPFYGREGTGYCNAAYSGACYTCTEAKDEYNMLYKEK